MESLYDQPLVELGFIRLFVVEIQALLTALPFESRFRGEDPELSMATEGLITAVHKDGNAVRIEFLERRDWANGLPTGVGGPAALDYSIELEVFAWVRTGSQGEVTLASAMHNLERVRFIFWPRGG